MKNRYFDLEKFIEFHRSLLHTSQSDERPTWQEQRAYEQGWTACLDALYESMNDDSMEKILKEIVDEMLKTDGVKNDLSNL